MLDYVLQNMAVLRCISLLLCILTVAIETREIGDDYPIREVDQVWLNSLFYLPSEPRVRKEYRMMTDTERYQYNDAFVKMKHDESVIPNKYDLFCSMHARRSTRNSAHRGTGFMGWHRVYILLMENAMREWYPDLTMPYWDTTLDAALELPRESSLWSEDFMGNGDGYVKTGVFANWTAQDGNLYRTVGALHAPLSDKNISYLMQHEHIGNISYPLQGKNLEYVFEVIHNRVHHFVGGEMKLIETAADDPVFFMYHSFISYITADFHAVQRLKGIDPETDWDEHYGQARHHKYSPLGLGNLLTIDGSSDIFEENIVFTDRPSCSREDTDCGSPHLYCNVTVEKCCPWTVREYNIIKTDAHNAHIPFNEAAIRFIENKISNGFSQISQLELANDTVLTKYGAVFKEENDLFKIMEHEQTPHGHDSDTDMGSDGQYHGDESQDEHQERSNFSQGSFDPEGHEHSHEGHDHRRGQVIGGGKQIHYIAREEGVVAGYFAIIILAVLLVCRISFVIVRKCVSENKNKSWRSNSKKKYCMNGIVNATFNEDENRKRKSGLQVNRPDNIYTVTVTTNNCPSPEHNGTFVCFEKYSSKDAKEARETPTSVDRQASTVSNYLDMTYASHSSPEGIDEQSKHSDLFEKEMDTNDCDDTDVNRSRNSIENENFDIICSVKDDMKSEDSFDVFETYDNIMFKKEGIETSNKPITCNTASNEEFYSNYSTGTYM